MLKWLKLDNAKREEIVRSTSIYHFNAKMSDNILAVLRKHQEIRGISSHERSVPIYLITTCDARLNIVTKQLLEARYRRIE